MAVVAGLSLAGHGGVGVGRSRSREGPAKGSCFFGWPTRYSPRRARRDSPATLSTRSPARGFSRAPVVCPRFAGRIGAHRPATRAVSDLLANLSSGLWKRPQTGAGGGRREPPACRDLGRVASAAAAKRPTGRCPLAAAARRPVWPA